MASEITITCTGVQLLEYDSFKPYLCHPDKDLPKMYNQGWNSFRFVGGEPKFKGNNMPEIVRMETDKYCFYECNIMVVNIGNGKETTGIYSKSVNKLTGETIERFSFD